MKVLVTGGCGFLGSHICEHYTKKGWEVVAYDNMEKYELHRTGFNADKIRNYMRGFLEGVGVEVIEGDILDMRNLLSAAHNCNYIIHCAAQPAMTLAISNPVNDLNVNVHGTLNVLEAARLCKVPIVTCSTIHVYGNGINRYLKEKEDSFRIEYYPDSDVWSGEQDIDEDAPILTGILTPLHASKRALEIYTQVYADTYGVKAASFRLTGMYGPRQFGGEDHGWVANFAIRTVFGLPIKVFGTDKQVRDILYVKDAVKAFDLWFENGCKEGLYNIGGGVDCIVSINHVLGKLFSLTGKLQSITLEPGREGDLYYFCCCNIKAEKAFGWEPKIMPDVGLLKLVDWIKENKEVFK